MVQSLDIILTQVQKKKDSSNVLQWDMNKHRISFQPVCLQPLSKPLQVHIETQLI